MDDFLPPDGSLPSKLTLVIDLKTKMITPASPLPDINAVVYCGGNMAARPNKAPNSIPFANPQREAKVSNIHWDTSLFIRITSNRGTPMNTNTKITKLKNIRL